ncbi:2-aminoethylphosphonate--pyruvate transaminase [Enterococcus faecalis 13-SD-W-01]|nr:2-aminoethylphosphonate--pyruvate transaminase [Enterococcus faecalis 13-SD-W-01]
MYKLLTPGPLTTSDTVKEAMLVDHCTWDDDYKIITQAIRKELLRLANVSEEEFTTVLLQGSGSFCVEAVLSSTLSKEDKLLICSNGAYGKRMVQMIQRHGVRHTVYQTDENTAFDNNKIQEILTHDPEITAVTIVHNETTSGLLNDLEELSQLVKEHELLFIVDAMSSFGGIPIAVKELGIHFLISSANKCIQGVPGFGFVICEREALAKTKGNARTVSLDLHEQQEVMEKDGKWRYTSPTHTVLAFAQALKELQEEGGIEARYQRYFKNNQILYKQMTALGFERYVKEGQGPFITSFLYPKYETFDFGSFYAYLKENGFAIYPGKISNADSFRIGNIGDIYPEDMYQLTEKIKEYMEQIK